MSVSGLSAATQNYLKVIWGLQEWSDSAITASEVAAKLGLRLSSVSDAIRRLGEQGLVEHAPYGSIQLTADGRRHALAMVRRHRLIETFLVQVLRYRWDEVHDEAEDLEHAVSDLMVDRIDAFLGRPERDPHGDPIPRADGSVQRLTAIPLSEAPPGATAVVEQISDTDPGLLQFLADQGIGIGTRLDVGAGAPFSEAVEIRPSGGAAVSLGRAASEAVRVALVEQA
jgi:DtxR family Mn-dependent transcriptional regulator